MWSIPSARRRALLALAAAVCIFPMSGGAQPSGTAVEQHFLRAQQDQQRGLLDAAADEYKTVLRLQPGIPEAYVNLGLVYYAQAKFAASAQALGAAAKLRPGMRGVSLWLGIDDVKLDRPVQGAALLRDAVRQDPNDKLAQSWLGTALWDTGRMNAALLQFRHASAQFPDDPDVLFAAGEAYGKAVHQQTAELLEQSAGTALSDRVYADIYVAERDWGKAEGHLRRAIQRDPRSMTARLDLGEVLFDQAKFADAQAQFAQALSLNPQSAAALARNGEMLILLQQPAQGLSQIESGLKIFPSEALDALGLPVEPRIEQIDNSNAAAKLSALCHDAAEKLVSEGTDSPARQAALAALYARAGERDAAIRAYRSIGQIEQQPAPAAAASAYARGMLDLQQHHYPQAEDALLEWIAAHPQDRAAQYDLILVRHHIAMAEILRLIEVAPDSYHVRQLLGELYVDRGEDNKALTEFLAVAAAQPDLPGIHFLLGHLYWKHGDLDRALAELTRELQLDPGNPEANGELGAVLVSQHHSAEAIPHLELAIHSKPDLWPAYVQLGMAYAAQKNYARAEAAMRHALAHDPDGAAHYQLGRVLRAEGKVAQANQMFAQVRVIENEDLAASSIVRPADQAGKP
jgi:tetratricopeptide (TPR) repeat protein